jgi:hypothetical protein
MSDDCAAQNYQLTVLFEATLYLRQVGFS